MICVIPSSPPLLPPSIAGDVLNTVHEALLASERIEVSYRNSRNRREKFILHPLGLMLREPLSYLIALCNDYEDPRPFALHRIQTAKRTYLPARKPKEFNLARYANEQGLFGGGRMTTLRASVSSHLGVILGETPLEPKQRLGKPDKEGWRTLTASLRDTWQLRWWILSEGDRMIVESPKVIRDAIGATATRVAGFYST